MTPEEIPPSSPWPAAAWVMVGFTGLALAVAIVGEVLAPALVLDLVSLWPVGALALPAAAIAIPLRRRWPRLLALPPLLILTWVFISGGLHLARWEPLPSTRASVTGPTISGVSSARLELEGPEGPLELRTGADERLYLVEPILAGGEAGAPGAAEAAGEGIAHVVIAPRPPSTWFRFAGWETRLSPGVRWSLAVAGPRVAADLRGLAVDDAVFSGEGAIRLGTADTRVPVSIAGRFTVTVPRGAPVRVVGEAGAPEGWEETEDGVISPVEGEGWVISVAEGGSLQLEEA